MAGTNQPIPERPGDFERLTGFALEKEPFVAWPLRDVMEQRAIADREVNEVIFAVIQDADFEADFRNAITRITAEALNTTFSDYKGTPKQGSLASITSFTSKLMPHA